ncbi:MAG: oxygenase MpaB family protein [Sediminicola sp.]|tara:strand:- start:35448 stop:36230 length:783 start_codon:yes stop_codon:yes gene_type:complete
MENNLEATPSEYFVHKGSIVREIWGKGDTILFIFAGAAAEFAVNKAVDWLYFTKRLPQDPIGRLFSTVSYARSIILSDRQAASRAIACMAKIHSSVESERGAKIPGWAYRDVLFMLIAYSINAFQLLERKLTIREKEEVFEVFNRVGREMGLKGLPETFKAWKTMRQDHLDNHLEYSGYSKDLFRQYRKHLGKVRYLILIEVQKILVPEKVAGLLGFKRKSFLGPLIFLYRWGRVIKLDKPLKAFLLPTQYKAQIRSLDL